MNDLVSHHDDRRPAGGDARWARERAGERSWSAGHGVAANTAAVADGTLLLNSARILIVDDEQSNTTLLSRILQSEGASRIECVNDPRRALDAFRSFGPDVVLLDLHMPHLDGHAVMQSLRAATAPEDLVPILVLTADATPATRARALAEGAKDFLTKPFDRTELLLRIRNQLETRALYARLQGHSKELELRVRSQLEVERAAELSRRQMRERIEEVLAGRRLRMVFQPIFSLESGEVIGAEALARFDEEPRRTPDLWFSEAGAVGLGVDLELSAVATAIADIGALPGDAYLSVNLSPEAVCSQRLLAAARQWPAQRLVIEITEHARVDDYERVGRAIGELRSLGIRVAVDDAGAGFSSLQHILRLRPDIIKLDVTLTRNIHRDPVRRALASSLVSFADEIDASLVAEGVETVQEVATLKQLGVSCGQGFWLARPGPPPVPSRFGATLPRPSAPAPAGSLAGSQLLVG